MKKSKILAVVIAVLLLLPAYSCGKKAPEYASGGVVTVEGGKISGYLNDEESVAIYKGIPYASAPVGDLRFKAPRDVENWDGVLDCTLWGANAMQSPATTFAYWTKEFIQDTDASHYRNGVTYSEDCLFLNVWSSTKVTENKPVLVFIHGGGYNSGGASCPVYDGEALAKKDVVFVSVQYRVNIFGYLATDALNSENDGAGNFGLLDQIKALNWVHDNISVFGGNPNDVTIMGQSAGAGSVNAILCSPLAEGLFSGAVSLSHNSVIEEYLTVQNRISAAPSQLKSKTALELRAMTAESLASYSLSSVGPVIDGYALTENYGKAIDNKRLADVPLLTGMVAEDNLIYDTYASGSVSVVDSLMTLQNYIAIKRQKASYFSDVYVYLFNRNVPQDDLKTTSAYGAKHSYELAYFLGNFTENRKFTETDYELAAAMQNYLINFCKAGDPNGDGLYAWESSTGDYSYLNFDENISVLQVPKTDYEKVNDYYKLR